MNNIATAGYLFCALAFFILTIMLSVSWRGRIQGIVVILTSIVSMLWAVVSTLDVTNGGDNFIQYFFELLRDIAWISFLILLIRLRIKHESGKSFLRFTILAAIVIPLFILGWSSYMYVANAIVAQVTTSYLYILGFVLLSLMGLILIEQLFRNAPIDQRWSIKFFCLGVGGLFAYDFYLYTDALLLKHIDEHIWGARGYINSLVVPLIAISAVRTPEWSVPVHVSKKFVFHATTLIGAGIYLVAMAVGGYYIKLYGGEWGGIAQITFLFSAALLLGLLLFSGDMRAKLKIFLSRNFYRYKYDYREEWLKLIGALSNELDIDQFRMNAIRALADIVESTSGALWTKGARGNYALYANWNMDIQNESDTNNSELIKYFKNKEWVIDLYEYQNAPEFYPELILPDWLRLLPGAWLVFPLFHQAQLRGYVVLGAPRVKQNINWEDRGLLLTSGRQVASYIALSQANEALYEARQFEAFNRLSAYVVHDLKNIVAQLSLVVSNAEKHKTNPAFIEDAINTVSNATSKMNKLLAQLRKDRIATIVDAENKQIDLTNILRQVVARRSADQPVPKISCESEKIMIVGEEDRLLAVLEHMVQNAQDATAADGYIHIGCKLTQGKVKIEIEDNGCGMDERFVRDQLYKPFQTTKGNAGMGIGVYETKEYINILGGEMAVESNLNVGTTFTISLPLAK